MAQKLNRKLVFVVGSLVIVLVFGGVVVYAIQWRYNAERHVRAAEAFAAVGDFRKAADAYGRAVSKKPSNLEYLSKFREAIEQITPATDNEARERYQQMIGVLASEARVARDDPARWRAYLEAMREQSEAADNVGNWKAFADRCDDVIRAVSEDGTPHAIATLYRGYAGFRRIDSLNESERAATVVDLEAALKCKELNAFETDLAVGSLARAALRERAIAGGAGRADRLEATQAALDKAMERALSTSPEGLRTAIASLEAAYLKAQGNRQDKSVEAAAEALAQRALASADGMSLLEVARSLASVGPTGAEEAQGMLGAYVQKHPDAILHRRIYATTLRVQDLPSARRELKAVFEGERPKVGLLATLYEPNRSVAAISLFDVAFDEVDRAKPEERAAKITELEAAREIVAKSLEGAPDQSAVIRADGKVLLQKKDAMGAIVKFNEVFKKGSQVDLELYILSAAANLQVNEIGRALELVTAGLGVAPGNPALIKLRARLELSSARVADAVNTLRGLLEFYPDDAEAKELLALASSARAQDANALSGNDKVLAIAVKVQTAADAGDFDEARRQLAEAKKIAGPADARPARMAVVVEMQANNLEAARKLVKEGMAQFAADPALIRLNAVLASDDIVERILALSDSAVSDEKERTVLTYLRLLQTGQSMRDMADRERRLSQSTAAKTAENAEKVLNAAKEWRAKADQQDRAHPALLEADFDAAITQKNWAMAEEVAKLADQSTRDRTQAPLMRARSLLAQNRMQEAAQVMERAIQAGVDASTMYRMLGAALERMGNIEGSLRNYEESYKRRPGDMSTVRLLVGALVRSGNPQRGLEILRQARSLAGFEEDVGNTWLMLEAQMGDRRLAQRMRDARYSIVPTDTQNAIALASMLAISAPEREDVLADNGKPLFTESEWTGLDNASRNKEVDRVRDDWRKRAESIFTDLLRRDPRNIDAANAYSGLLRMLGRMQEAQTVLSDAVEAAGAAAGWRGYMLLGQSYCFLSDFEKAKAAFGKAITLEDQQSRDATRAIADMLMGMEQYGLALGYFEDVAKADQSRAMKLRLSECLLRLGRNADSRKMFDTIDSAGTREVGEEMLDGAIYVAIGDQLRKQGDIDGARAQFEKAIAPYQRAKAAAPSIPQPFIQDAMLKRKLFELTGERSRGEEALAAADRGVAVGATFYPACAARSEVLVSLGDLNGAVAELERFLRIAPTSVDARRRVTELLFTNNQLDRAEESLRQAIGYAPGEPAWYASLGDLLTRRGKLTEAADAYARSDQLRPDPTIFFRQLDALIRGRNFRGAIDACRSRGDIVRESPVARGYLGSALVALGEKGDGVATLRESFAAVKQAYDEGNSRPIQDWYGAIRLIFAPGLLNEAEALVKDVSGGDPTPVGWEYLSFLALGNDSAGPSRVIAYLEPVADRDYSKTPDFAAVLYDRLGTSYYLAGQCEKAVSAYEKALKYLPNGDAILNNYAYLCVDCLKDPKKALPHARLAVQLQPTRGEYLDTLAFVLIADRQFEEGLGYADRAAKLSDGAAVQLHRAMALVELKRVDQARQALARAAELNPDPPTKASIEQLLAKIK